MRRQGVDCFLLLLRFPWLCLAFLLDDCLNCACCKNQKQKAKEHWKQTALVSGSWRWHDRGIIVHGTHTHLTIASVNRFLSCFKHLKTLYNWRLQWDHKKCVQNRKLCCRHHNSNFHNTYHFLQSSDNTLYFYKSLMCEPRKLLCLSF